jgi:predicted aminopeptidase
MSRLFGAAVLLAVLLMQGCGYYYQAARGHMDIMSERRSFEDVIADPGTSEELKLRLATVQEARVFASDVLGLPDNDSYRSYVELDRPFVVWNVFAAAEFSVEPKRWCFPVAGCVVYRGYFSEQRAQDYAEGLQEKGWDVHVGGVAAYSTLGRFDDPVLSSMLRWDDTQLVALLFHELSHQLLYVKDDSDFNESFASFVEEAGIERWYEAREDKHGVATYREHRERVSAFGLLISDTRTRLADLYQSGLPDEEMRKAKTEEFADLRDRYAAQRRAWGGYTGYDAWFESDLNNAKIVPVATYRRFVPAFRAILREADGDLPRFYDRCRELADLPIDERHRILGDYMSVAPAHAARQRAALRVVSLRADTVR